MGTDKIKGKKRQDTMNHVKSELGIIDWRELREYFWVIAIMFFNNSQHKQQ